ncbi:MAG: ATP-binding protein [Eubacteriales bacterium]|nr:ATP-binding protein [Eubacteriales bacterium]
MSEYNKVIALIGENGSGKTTLAIEIAKQLERLDKSIIIINTDEMDTFLQFYNIY